MDQNTLILISVGVLTLILLVVAIAKLSSLAKSLQRLSEQIPGTGMTAKELATELGGSIETSFQKFMPQPEKVSSAITASVETALKTASANIENIHKKLLDGQDAVLDKWAAHEKTTTSGLSGISKALEAATQQMSAGLTGGSQKMQSSLDDGAKKLADTLGSLTAKLEASLKDHADKTGQASAQLAAQLEKIAGLQTEVEKLLHLQQATEGTIKSVAASDEFKTLIKALRDHLAASDTFLREAAKPRTIRLVEQEA